MVDWDLAVTTGTFLVRPGPVISRQEARDAVADLRRYAEQAQGHVRDYTGLVADTDGSSVAVIDRPAWIRANAEGFRTVLEPVIEKLQKKGSSSCGGHRGGRPHHRRADRRAARVPRHQGARPVRAVPRRTATDRRSRPGRLLLVAPNIVAAEQRARRRPARLPAVGVPARGDPPRAVRRGALAARAPHDRDPRLRRGDRPGLRRRSCGGCGAPASATTSARGADGVRGRLAHRRRADARRSARSSTASPPSCPCSRGTPTRHGRRRPDGRSRRSREIRAQFQRRAQGTRPARAGRSPAARHRRQAAAVPRRRSLRPRRRRARSGMAGFNGCGPRPRPCRPRPRSPTRRAGSPAWSRRGRCPALTSARGSARPAVAPVRLAVRRGAGRPRTPGDLVLVACSGGADSLALAAAAGVRGAAARAASPGP